MPSVKRSPTRLLDYSNRSDALPKELVGDFSNGYLYLLNQDKELVKVPVVKSLFILKNKDATLNTYDPSSENSVQIDINTLFTGKNGINISDGNIIHDDSGITAGDYGNTENLSLNYGESFKVPCFTVDSRGHLTIANTHTITLPKAPISVDKLSTKRSISLEGAISGSIEFDGSEDVQINTTLNSLKEYTVTIPTTNWVGDTAPYYCDVNVDGILETDTPFIDALCINMYEDSMNILSEWSKIFRIITEDNNLKIYAVDKPLVEIPIIIKCIRKK